RARLRARLRRAGGRFRGRLPSGLRARDWLRWRDVSLRRGGRRGGVGIRAPVRARGGGGGGRAPRAGFGRLGEAAWSPQRGGRRVGEGSGGRGGRAGPG